MKKLFCLLAVLLGIAASLAACGNKQLFDTTYTFNRAVISLPDGTVISGEVDSWTDFAEGDQMQVVIDGTTYLVHSSSIALIADAD
ncbi:MAG: hypothetical protein IKU55_04205 [Clostridia bacterium]|nr:hypothetical protein [Clostridia bacterium]